MAWLYLPLVTETMLAAGKPYSDYHSVLAPEASILDSTSPCPDIELFVMSSGTPTPQPLSWRGWKTRHWIKRLSGTTLPVSTANRGVASWISFMAVIHANLLASPDENSAIKTHDTSGPISDASSPKSTRRFASSKMSADIYDWASNKSMMTFDRWVTVLRLACLQRRKSALPIDENDCSSWPTATATDSRVNEARPPEKMIRKDGRNVLRTPSLAETVLQPLDFPYTKQDLDLAHQELPYQVAKAHWPTATATDGEKGGPNSRHGNGTLHLAAAAVQTLWYTPNCPNGGRTNPAEMSLTGAMPDGRKRQVGLENQARFVWPTPMANPNTNRQTKPTPSQMKGEHGLNLAMVAVQSSWPTPRTCAGKRSSGSNRTEIVNSWATPQAHDVAQGNPERVGRFGTKAGGRNLTDEGVAWATPMSRDWKDGAATSDNVPTNSILGRQAPRSMKDGNASTLSLNPLFVEWLMGWPIGWTDCASAVTGLSPWLRLMRSELSRLLQASTSDQLDLFA